MKNYKINKFPKSSNVSCLNIKEISVATSKEGLVGLKSSFIKVIEKIQTKKRFQFLYGILVKQEFFLKFYY